jgi:hypothetical protein
MAKRVRGNNHRIIQDTGFHLRVVKMILMDSMIAPYKVAAVMKS